MAEFHFDNLAKNLPDAYKKDSSSNNFKILEIERVANDESRSILYDIANIFDIDNAVGAILDMYGARFGQSRGKATDEQYRAIIKSKIIRKLCNGSYKNIVDAVCYTFGCTKDDVLIVETDKPMNVKALKVPIKGIIEAGFDTSQAEQIIKSLLPITVTLESVMFDGTFEFGATENEYDEAAGFGESVDSKIGGYLGQAYSQENKTELPI